MQAELNQFTLCQTRNEVKSVFRTLAKKYHPDTGGNADLFKLLVNVYETALDRVTNVQTMKSAETVQATWKEQAQTFKAEELSPFADLIAQVKSLNLRDIRIVQRESWLWIENTTREMYQPLRDLGFQWSRKRRAMYFAENLGKCKRYSSRLSKDDLDRKYNARAY